MRPDHILTEEETVTVFARLFADALLQAWPSWPLSAALQPHTVPCLPCPALRVASVYGAKAGDASGVLAQCENSTKGGYTFLGAVRHSGRFDPSLRFTIE